MNERIKMIRNSLNLTRAEFGKQLGVSGDVINNLERGRVETKEIIIISICREFGINEEWLRTGAGDMFVKRTRNQIITDFAGDLIGEPDTFRTRLVEGLAKLNPEDWEDIERVVVKLTKKED